MMLVVNYLETGMGLIMSKDMHLSVTAHIVKDTEIEIKKGLSEAYGPYTTFTIGDVGNNATIFIDNSRILEIIESLKEQLSPFVDKDDKQMSYEVKTATVKSTTTFERGWGNGYVGIGKDHPLFRVDYSQLWSSDLEVHGGITFSELIDCKDENSEWHVLDGMWAFGFDTAHGGDDQYSCNELYVKRQLGYFAKQLVEWSPSGDKDE